MITPCAATGAAPVPRPPRAVVCGIRALAASLPALACLGAPCPADAQPVPPTIEALGWPAGRPNVYPIAISADGAAATGYADPFGSQASHAFRWTRATLMQDLGVLPGTTLSVGRAISADGSTVAGNSGPRAFRWTAQGGMEDLGPGTIYALSADGTVAAGAADPGSGTRAFRWTAADGRQDLGMLPDGTSIGAAAISADGATIVGSCTVNMLRHAFIWTASGGVRDLGLPGGAVYAAAMAVSADGAAVTGHIYTAPRYHAFRWTEAGGMEILDLAASAVYGWGNGISHHGSMLVGRNDYSIPEPSTRAALWTRTTGLVDLPDYLSARGLDLYLAGWDNLRDATAITPDGSAILGFGQWVGMWQQAFIVHLHTCAADWNADESVTSQDFFEFLAAFFDGEADFNTDGATNSQDFFDFLTAFFAGCP